MAYHQTQHIAALRSERHANTDFMHAFGDRLAHHTIASHRGKHERERREGANEPKGQTARGHRFGNDLLHGAHVVHGKLRIDLSDEATRRSIDRTRIAVCAHGKPDVRPGILRKRVVAFQGDGFSEAIVHDVANHSDDFRLLIIQEVEVLPQRILAGPQSFGELLIDDHDRSGIGVVACGKFAAAKQWNAHGLEISGIDGVDAGERLLAALVRSTPLDIAEARGGVVAFQRKIIRDSDPFDAGKRGNAGKKLFEKLRRAALGRVVRAGKIHPHRNHVIGAEAGIDFEHAHEAAAQQTGANEKHQRESDFRDDEKAAKAIVSKTLGAAAPGFVQEMAEAVTRGGNGGREPEEQTGQERNAKSEEQNAQVQSDFLHAGQLLWAGGHEQAHQSPGQNETEPAAYEREQHALREKLAHDAQTASAERRTDGDFPSPRHRARQEQIRDIGASNQQDEADDGEQYHEGLAHRPGRELTQRNQLYIVARGDGILLVQARNDGVDIALCLRERDAGLEAADDVQIVGFAVAADISLPVGKGAEDLGNDVNRIDPELNVRAAVPEVGGEDADDLHGLVVESEGAANDGAVAGKVALPEAVGEQRAAR